MFTFLSISDKLGEEDSCNVVWKTKFWELHYILLVASAPTHPQTDKMINLI